MAPGGGRGAGAGPAGEAAGARGEGDPRGEPPRGTEVFVGNLAAGGGGGEVAAHFAGCGAVHAVRRRPGEKFAFVVFRERAARERAVAELDGSQLGGRAVRVREAASPSRLFVGGLPKAWAPADFDEAVGALELRGLEGTQLMLNREGGPNGCRGYGFLQFYNHACALEAKRAMTAPGFGLGVPAPVCSPTVNLADDSPAAKAPLARPAPDHADGGGRTLFVQSVPDGASVEDLMLAFGAYGVVDRVQTRPHAREGPGGRTFAFVHFKTNEAAQLAEAAGRAGEIAALGQKLQVFFRQGRGGAAPQGGGGDPPAAAEEQPAPGGSPAAPRSCCEGGAGGAGGSKEEGGGASGCGCSCSDCTCGPSPAAAKIAARPAPFPGGDPIFQQGPSPSQIQEHLQKVLPPPDNSAGHYPAHVIDALNVLQRYAAETGAVRSDRWAPY